MSEIASREAAKGSYEAVEGICRELRRTPFNAFHQHVRYL